MACLERLGIEDAGSDIDFSIRPDEDGSFPDISDMTCNFIGVFGGSELFNVTIGSPSPNGTAVTLESDITSQYLALHIEGAETIGLNGDLEIYTHLESSAYGTRTEAKGVYRICEVI